MEGATLDILVPAVASLLLVAFLAGAVLLYPISRRLAELLQLHVEERRQGANLDPEELQRLRATIAEHEQRIAALTEQQEFVERVLGEARPGEPLPRELGERS